jgi:hypothetical protein
MWVKIYGEGGYEHAMRAARLSRRSQDRSDTIGNKFGERDTRLCEFLFRHDERIEGQPNTVGLRQIVFWIGVSAPLYWWKHMDRYTIGKDQASDSTMYNIMYHKLDATDFERRINVEIIHMLNEYIENKDFDAVIANLPGSYLQERSLMISLPTLRRIISQRKDHKLIEWKIFISEILAQAQYPDLLT